MNRFQETFKDFSAAQKVVFAVKGSGLLQLTALCDVAVVPGLAGQIIAQIDADEKDLEAFSLTQEGNVAIIKQTRTIGFSSVGSVIRSSGSVVIVGNTVISSTSGGNISVVGNRVFVNGVEVKPGAPQSKNDPSKLPRILIKVPEGGRLEATINGLGSLYAAAGHLRAEASLYEQSRAYIEATSQLVTARGQSQAESIVNGGDLSATVSDQGTVKAKGTFGSVTAHTSDQSSVKGEGPVQNDYVANATGMSSIKHRGGVGGRIVKNASGMASVSIG